MEKIILFGTGKLAADVLELIKKMKCFEIVEVWDNDEKKHGLQYYDIGEIRKPREQNEYVILVASVYFADIREGLVNNYKVSDSLIKPWEYCFYHVKEQIMQRYSDVEEEEIQDILKFLEKENLDVYNYPFKDKYQRISIETEYDIEKKMFYSFWHGKKMYLSRKYSSRGLAGNYVRYLMLEQDKESPHYYGDMRKYLTRNGIVIDAGAAEGMWALDALDYAEKVILIESDKEWLEALYYTFEPYRHKVEIIEKPLVEKEKGMGITLSELYRKEGRIACIKMDIEGVETDILRSEHELLKTDAIEKLLVCTYHKPNDAQIIKDILSDTGYQTEFSKGYMFFPHGKEILPELRRGIIRAEK